MRNISGGWKNSFDKSWTHCMTTIVTEIVPQTAKPSRWSQSLNTECSLFSSAGVWGKKKKKTHTFGQDTKFTQPQAWWIHTPLISVSWPIKLLDLAHARATSFLIVAIRWDRYKYLALSFVRSQSVNCGVSRITHLFSNFGQRCYFPTETQVRAPLDSCALVFNAFRFVCWWVVL